MNGMFTECSSLKFLDLSSFDVSNVKNLEKIFSNCNSLTSIELSNFETKSATNMNGVFLNCSSLLYLNLTSFDTSQVTNMNSMFKNCSSLKELYIPNFVTSSNYNTNEMFSGCISLLKLDVSNNFDTSLVSNMKSMFKACESLTSLDLSSFNTNSVNNMEMMFFGCSSLTSLNLYNFYTNSLKTMDHLFNGCQSLEYLNISNFNTSLAKNMAYIFKNCFKLKSIDLSSFDTSSVTTMSYMFSACSSLNYLDLSNFITSTVKNMAEMFGNCTSLEFVNLTGFNISHDSISNIFYNCNSLKSVDLTNFVCNNINNIFTNLNAINIINRTNSGINQDKDSDINQDIKISTSTLELVHNSKVIDSTQIINENKKEKIIEIIEYYNTNIKEIITNLDKLIEDKEPTKTYKIKGNDYQLYIKPINSYTEDSSVNIYLNECEKILKEKNPSEYYTIVQINLKNNCTNCLVDQVEYKIYDANKQAVDISICNNINIKIEYKIQNSSLINLDQVKTFNEKGIDIFNIKDIFFNDICYPYTDDNSNSDMILSDRVTDIFQNYSICGDNCEYDSFNIYNTAANCNCKIKNEVKTEVKEGNFETSIQSAFFDSNFGVIKCYNIVFGIKGKLKNAGFWIFGIFTVIHIPTYILLIINGINPIKSYIKN